jgi:hypothetical protein
VSLTAAQCAALVLNAAQHQCVAIVSTAPAAAVDNPAQPKFDALAASFGALSVAITIGAIVIAVLTIVITALLTFIGYQWAKVVVREAKDDAKIVATNIATAAIEEFLKNDAPKLIRDGRAGLQSTGSDLNVTQDDASDKIGEVA